MVMRDRLTLAWLTFLLSLLAACGPKDATPPQVLANYPQDGYHGFKRDESIRITFSEPMDTAATEEAFQLFDPGGAPLAVDFAWENENRRLVVTPQSPLAYSPDASYLSYRYLLTTAARDRAGNPLERGLDVTFTTLRTLTAVRDSVAALDGAVSDLGFVYNDPNDPSAYPTAPTGDTAGNRGVRSFFAFDLGGLGIEPDDLAYAHVGFFCDSISGDPSGDLGNLRIERVNYLESGGLDGGDYGAAVLDQVGAAGGWGSGQTLTLDVDTPLQNALAEGQVYLQLRLRFAQETDGDSAEDAVFVAAGEDTQGHAPRLEIGYYAP